jgi:hypothetical protein
MVVPSVTETRRKWSGRACEARGSWLDDRAKMLHYPGFIPKPRAWHERTLPITEHGVRRILPTLTMVVCISIAAGKDRGSSGLGGEARGQDQRINQADGGTRSQQGSKASGGETQDQGPVRKACQSEIERLCPGEEHAGRCLRSHSADQLSEACKAALANRGSSR